MASHADPPTPPDDLAGLVDIGSLTAWMDGAGIGAGPLSVERIRAGASNEMFVLARGPERWVLRRPAGVAPERAEDGLRREYTLLCALDRTPVPHPGAVGLCEDREVLGSVFYVMAHVDGIMPGEAELDTPDERSELALGLVDALAQLHLVDWQGVGLAGFGRPDGFHERQVARWMRQLESYQGRELPGIFGVGEWLATNTPRVWQSAVMHGDYHTLNVLVARQRPRQVVAIVDWETATIGDPYVDLAGFLRIYDERTARAGEPGWPDREAMIARYAEVRGADVPDLTYYSVLARFRLAVLLEGVYQRSLVDPTRSPSEQMAAYVAGLVTGAVDEIEAASPR